MSEKNERALKSIFKGGSIFFTGMIISKLFGLGYRVLVGRYLGPADYGVISVAMAVFSVATTLSFVGIPNGVQKYIAQFREEERIDKAIGTYRSGASMMLISTTLFSIGLFIAAPWISNNIFHEPKAVWAIRIVALAVPFRGLHTISMNVTNAFEKMQYHVYSERIWNNFSQLALAVILVYLEYGYIGAIAAYAISFTTAAFLSVYYAKKMIPDLFSPSAESISDYRQLFSHSWPLLAAGVFGIVVSHIDTFMLQSFKNSSTVGIYNAAYPFAALLLIGLNAFESIFLSNASRIRAKGGELLDTYRSVVKWVSIVTAPLFLIMFIFPRTALSIFGREYYTAGNILRVLSVGFVISAVTGPVSNIYQAVERTKLNFITTVILAVLNGVLNYLLIPMYDGAMGAAAATTLSFAGLFIVNIFLVRTVLGGFPFKMKILKVWIAAGISIIIPFLVSNWLFDFTPYWFFAIDLAIMGVTYAVLLLLFRTLEEDDLVVIRAIREKLPIEVDWLEDLVRRFS